MLQSRDCQITFLNRQFSVDYIFKFLLHIIFFWMYSYKVIGSFPFLELISTYKHFTDPHYVRPIRVTM